VDTAALAAEAPVAHPALLVSLRSASGESLDRGGDGGSTGTRLGDQLEMRRGMEVISDARRANMVPQRCVRRSVAVMARTLELRSLGQCAVGARFKFGRFFSPTNYQVPETWDDLFGENDVVCYDVASDPYELVNLAHPRYRDANRATLLGLNAELNALVAAEAPAVAGVPLPWTSGAA